MGGVVVLLRLIGNWGKFINMKLSLVLYLLDYQIEQVRRGQQQNVKYKAEGDYRWNDKILGIRIWLLSSTRKKDIITKWKKYGRQNSTMINKANKR